MKITRYIKNITFLLFALVALVGTAISVSAASGDYDFNHIQVDGLTMSNATVLDFERGDRLDIEVYLDAFNDTDDVTITAKIMGYEFGSISDSTGQFSLDAGKTYKKTLTLEIPEDIDASEEYTLRIEASDQLDEITEEFTIHIDESRHGLKIYDVVLNPSSTIAAGNPLFVSVRLENLGEMEEDDVKITASIPDLGISAINYFDELNTEYQEQNENNFEQDNSDQLDLLLRIPTDAATGTYELRIDVEYNRGYNFLSQSLNINVQGTEADEGVQTVVNSDSSSKATGAGSSVDYKVMMANLGSEPGVYSVQVDGVSAWGEVTVQPSFLTVMPDSTGEVTITVTPFDSTEDASYTWVAKVMLGSDVLSEVVFNTKVDAAEEMAAAKTDVLKTVLTIVFAILVVVLVVLALIIAFRKVRSEDEDSTSLEGQTYYQYYPKR
tara:strand:- start:3611 stop:4927 length:1317 start_codon:yes stop_codon:yes gene_type:complete